MLRKQHSETTLCHTRTKRCCVETGQRNVLLLKQPNITMLFPIQKSYQMAVSMLQITVTSRKNVMLLKQHMISGRRNSFFCVSFASAPY
jgi:hypothetical protein